MQFNLRFLFVLTAAAAFWAWMVVNDRSLARLVYWGVILYVAGEIVWRLQSRPKRP